MIQGGQPGNYRFRYFSNQVRHRFGSGLGAITPYGGIGTNILTAALPRTNVGTWTEFDDSLQRHDFGGMVEWSGFSPWYLRADANGVTRKGIKVIAGSKGTSPGNGSIDLPAPVDWTTENYSLEGGYQERNRHLAVTAHYSRFKNDNSLLFWSNNFFAGVGAGAPLNYDRSVLPANNDLWKVSANGNMRGLPFSSTIRPGFLGR